jgi:hypothetical protein
MTQGMPASQGGDQRIWLGLNDAAVQGRCMYVCILYLTCIHTYTIIDTIIHHILTKYTYTYTSMTYTYTHIFYDIPIYTSVHSYTHTHNRHPRVGGRLRLVVYQLPVRRAQQRCQRRCGWVWALHHYDQCKYLCTYLYLFHIKPIISIWYMTPTY